MNIEIQKKRREISSQLSALYPEPEANQMARWLLEEAYGTSYPQLVMSEEVQAKHDIEEWVRALGEGVPIQYVLGYAEFAGMKLRVTPDVLIPRPETEELCHLIKSGGLLRSNSRVIDLCTGSGCIALALKKMEPTAKVDALDVSQRALVVARFNFSIRKQDIRVLEADLFDASFSPETTYDLVVSNPPYVLEQEKKEMKPYVLQREPSEALFVPDDDGVKFYRRIFELYTPFLSEGGAVAFELNPLTAEEVLELGNDFGLKGELRKDFCGKNRFYFGKL